MRMCLFVLVLKTDVPFVLKYLWLCVLSEQKLEETCEELQRVTEAESLLRTRCAYLEEKQRQTKDQIEVKPNDCILSFPHI